jgi:hypothetical protein
LIKRDKRGRLAPGISIVRACSGAAAATADRSLAGYALDGIVENYFQERAWEIFFPSKEFIIDR